VRGEHSKKESRWTPELGVKAAVAAVVVAIVFGVAAVALGVVPLLGASDDPPTRTAPGPTSDTPSPTPDPEQLKAVWRREQGDLCERWNEAAARLTPVAEGATLVDAIPNLRAGVRELRALGSGSLALDVPDDFSAEVQRMVGYWSAAAVHGDGMIRAAAVEDQARYDQQQNLLDQKLTAGLRVAFNLGATQCV
jgi:hypothetical protein